jgi:hypothetical protein
MKEMMMKEIWKKGMFFLFLIIISSGCKNAEIEKPSLLIEYLDESANWAGVDLGETQIEQTEELIIDLDAVDDSTIWVGQRFGGLGQAICVEFFEGFRENGVCIHHIDGKAQGIEFFGGRLTIEEVEHYLGPIEKIVVQFNQREIMWLNIIGVSQNSELVFTGNAESKDVDHTTTSVEISSDSSVAVSLVNPEFLRLYMSSAITGESYIDYYFDGGGFEEWHGPGEYDVLHWSPFD